MLTFSNASFILVKDLHYDFGQTCRFFIYFFNVAALCSFLCEFTACREERRHFSIQTLKAKIALLRIRRFNEERIEGIGAFPSLCRPVNCRNFVCSRDRHQSSLLSFLGFPPRLVFATVSVDFLRTPLWLFSHACPAEILTF